jgi:hypothetical protein
MLPARPDYRGFAAAPPPATPSGFNWLRTNSGSSRIRKGTISIVPLSRGKWVRALDSSQGMPSGMPPTQPDYQGFSRCAKLSEPPMASLKSSASFRFRAYSFNMHARNPYPNSRAVNRKLSRNGVHSGEARFHSSPSGFQSAHRNFFADGKLFEPWANASSAHKISLESRRRSGHAAGCRLTSRPNQIGQLRHLADLFRCILDQIRGPMSDLICNPMRPGGPAILIKAIHPQRQHTRRQPSPCLCSFHNLTPYVWFDEPQAHPLAIKDTNQARPTLPDSPGSCGKFVPSLGKARVYLCRT